jgi:hypothetical protein
LSRRAIAKAAVDAEASALEAIGLRKGEEVRFRRVDRSRWQLGCLNRLERDGSLRITDADGAARTIALSLVEVRVDRSRSTTRWEPAAERAGRSQQLTLSW